MKKLALFVFVIAMFALFFVSLTSALTVSLSDSQTFTPGETQDVRLDISNDFDYTVKDVSLSFILVNPSTGQPLSLPFTFLNSEDSTEEIKKDKTETFTFNVKSSNDAKAGDYLIPYTLSYRDNNSNKVQKTGTMGLTIKASPQLDFSVNAQTPVIGQKTRLSIKIVNKGLADAKFVSLKLIPQGYTLLSDSNVYIGTISMDDFDSANFDIIFKSTSPIIIAEMEYRDFDNKKITETINLPLTVYSQERAVSLGIIQKSYTFYYIIIAVLIVIVIFIVRKVRKSRKLRKAEGNK